MINETAEQRDLTARVLVITADADVKSFINSLMVLRHIRAGVTESPENASQFLSTNAAPDVVILDLDVSETRALEFLRQLRRHNTLVRLPVLALTSFPDPTLVRKAIDAGANRYLTKIFMVKNMLSTLREIMDQASMERTQQTAPLRSSAAISTNSGG